MKQRLLYLLLFMVVWTIHAENVHYGDYTLPGPGVVSPDLVIIGGNLDLKDSFTVDGDLKIIGGYVSVASDNESTSTVNLYVLGDLIVSNTNETGTLDGYINVPTGHVFVTGEIFAKSDNGDAYVNGCYGIQAGRVETSAVYDARVTSSTGSIVVEEDIVTKSIFGNARVQAGDRSVAPVSYDIRAAAISTWSEEDSHSAYVEADGSIEVRDEIVTKCPNGEAYVSAASYYPGGIKAGSILTNGEDDAYVSSGDEEGPSGFIDVAGDIVTTSIDGDAGVYSYYDYLRANNICTNAYYSAAVTADGGDLNVRGDVATKSRNGRAYVSASTITARSITTDGGREAYVWSDYQTNVEKEIVTKSSGEDCNVSVGVEEGPLRAGSISTKTDGGNAYVYADEIDVAGTINTYGGSGYCWSAGPVHAGSVFASAADPAYVQSSEADITVKDDIQLYSEGSSAWIDAYNGVTARSIDTYGQSAFVLSNHGSVNVTEDITTYAWNGDAYVKAPEGNVVAQKIRAESYSEWYDDSIQSAAGSGIFTFVPVDTDLTTTIKDAEFSFDADHEWNTRMTIAGTCTINGNGHLLTFGDTGGITVTTGATLVLRNVQLRNLTGTQISCFDTTGTIKMHDVSWAQKGNYSFTQGALEVFGNFVIQGPGTMFTFGSGQSCTIHENSRLVFGQGVTFKYNAGTTDKLVMIDNSSQLNFDGATLNATQSVRFTKGTLVFDNYVIFTVAQIKTVYFGNGVQADNIKIVRHPASQLNVEGLGSFVNANV